MTKSRITKRGGRGVVVPCVLALVIASVAVSYRGDDWAMYDHKRVRVAAGGSDNVLQIKHGNGQTDRVKLLGVEPVNGAGAWLSDQAAGKDITLLLESPQTRDDSGQLRAFAFLENQNLSVELTKAGFAYADRREKTQMDGLIDAAEGEARKKKRGLWATLNYEQMPAWRQAWLKTLPRAR